MADLKPCPFCGTSEKVHLACTAKVPVTKDGPMQYPARVICTRCTYQVIFRYFHNVESAEKFAVEMWNRRGENV